MGLIDLTNKVIDWEGITFMLKKIYLIVWSMCVLLRE